MTYSSISLAPYINASIDPYFQKNYLGLYSRAAKYGRIVELFFSLCTGGTAIPQNEQLHLLQNSINGQPPLTALNLGQDHLYYYPFSYPWVMSTYGQPQTASDHENLLLRLNVVPNGYISVTAPQGFTPPGTYLWHYFFHIVYMGENDNPIPSA